MDLVVNHTSSEHAWFRESSASQDNPKRDWYLWRAPKPGGKPPNNWDGLFSGPAWTLDPRTHEDYFHLFDASQPDLNWANPAVRQAVYSDMHFWLEKGVAGFRMDAINLISKPAGFPDAEEPGQACWEHVANREDVHGYLREMRREVFEKYPDRDLMTVGECGGTDDVEITRKYIGRERGEMDMIFQFEHCKLDIQGGEFWKKRAWKLTELKELMLKWQTVLRPSWNTFHFENHDGGRSVNRFGRAPEGSGERWFPAISKMLAVFVMTLGGTIFLHQGQEIGMANLRKDVPFEEYKDPALKQIRENLRRQRARERGVREEEVDMGDFDEGVRLKGRDHGRVPMAWDGGAHEAGFTTGTPWMCLNTDWREVNVKEQDGREGSTLEVWREMIRLRKEFAEECVFGEFELVDEENEKVFAYYRTSRISGRRLLVVLNWCAEKLRWRVPGEGGRKLLKGVGWLEEDGGELDMEAYAAVILEVGEG